MMTMHCALLAGGWRLGWTPYMCSAECACPVRYTPTGYGLRGRAVSSRLTRLAAPC